MPRFAILEHDHPELHWDLLLERGPVLRAWRLAQPPTQIGQTIAAVALAEHRLVYLDYEGPVSGNRGTVRRWDHGFYEEAVPSSAGAALIDLAGAWVRGRVGLRQVHAEEWTCLFERTP
jgi:hypothetical protein